MKSLLVFPAQWYPTQPYLSTPYLCAYLRGKGWDVSQRDFNIESYDHFLSPILLEKAVARMVDRLACLKGKKSFSIKEKSLMDVLATGIKFAPTIISRVNEAKLTMRTPDQFFDFQTYKQADMIIKSALKLVSDAYAPSILTLSTFESGTAPRSRPNAPPNSLLMMLILLSIFTRKCYCLLNLGKTIT